MIDFAAAAPVTVRDAAPDELARWDEIVRAYANHRATHLRAWVEALVDSGSGTPLWLLFERDGAVVGAQPGLLTTVGPWTLYGSPRAGWQTVSLGPAFDPARVTTGELMEALVRHLEERHSVAQIEILHPALDHDAMRALGFDGEALPTFRAPLYPGDEAKSFKTLKDSARRNVQRGERLGLEVRFENEAGPVGERFVDEHFDQVREVYERGGHAVPFGKARVREIFRHMQAAGALVAVAVYLPGGRVCIATGMFFVEGKELLLWTWAHRTRYRWYRPTELMTWTVIKRALAAGCETLDFMGRGEFKRKFGAELDASKFRWVRSRPAWLTRARHLAEAGFRWQQSVRGSSRRLGHELVERARHAARAHHRRVPAYVLGDVDLVRALGLAGIESVVMAPPGAAARYSRFTREALAWIEPWERPEAVVDALVARAEQEPEPPVLYYQEDRSLLVVSRHRERLAQSFRFVLPDEALVEALVDKHRFQELAAQRKLPVPPAWSLLPTEEMAIESLPIDYPVIVKPVVRRQDRWRTVAGDGQGKALRADTPEALRAIWCRLSRGGMAVLVQSMIPGPETLIESYHVYADAKGTVTAEFTGRKIRTYPESFGDSCAVEITDAEDVRAAGREAVKRLGLRGVAKFDFKRGADGELFLLEVNPRFTLWHHAGALAGVNIPAMVHADCTGAPRPAAGPVRTGVRWCKVWTDRPAAQAGGVPLRVWLPWMLACEAKSAFAWDDPMPLLGAGVRRWLGHASPGAMSSTRRWAGRRDGGAPTPPATNQGIADPGSPALQHPRRSIP